MWALSSNTSSPAWVDAAIVPLAGAAHRASVQIGSRSGDPDRRSASSGDSQAASGPQQQCEVQARLCAQGAGIAVLPRPLGDHAQGIVAIDIDEAPPARDTFVGHLRDLRRQTRLRALLVLLIERLAG